MEVLEGAGKIIVLGQCSSDCWLFVADESPASCVSVVLVHPAYLISCLFLPHLCPLSPPLCLPRPLSASLAPSLPPSPTLCLPRPLLPLLALLACRASARAMDVDSVRPAEAALIFAHPAPRVADLPCVSLSIGVVVVLVGAAGGRRVCVGPSLLTVSVGGDFALGVFRAEVC